MHGGERLDVHGPNANLPCRNRRIDDRLIVEQDTGCGDYRFRSERQFMCIHDTDGGLLAGLIDFLGLEQTAGNADRTKERIGACFRWLWEKRLIKGFPLDEMNGFLLEKSEGISAHGLWSAPKAIKIWLDRIRDQSADDKPLDWITAMVRVHSIPSSLLLSNTNIFPDR